MTQDRRRSGTGSMFIRASDNIWVGSIECGSPRGKRRQKRVTSKTFCGMLKKFSQLPQPEVKPVRSRQENVKSARQRGTHAADAWLVKVAKQNGRCHYCGEQSFEDEPRMIMGVLRLVPKQLEKDHMIPVSRGGSDSITNLVGACQRCNAEKGTMSATEYIALRKRRHRRTSLVRDAVLAEVKRQNRSTVLLDCDAMADAIIKALGDGG